MSDRIISKDYVTFLEQIKARVATSRYQAALAVNGELLLLYHHIGTEIIRNQKVYGWGAGVVAQLSKDLKSEFPDMKGFSPQNLKYMRRFAEEYTLDEIGQQAIDQLPWGHNIDLMYSIPDKNERQFYIKKIRQHGWSRNVLSMQIETNLYQREGKA